MKALTLTILISLISAASLAGNVDMNSGADCNQRRDPYEGMSNLQRFLCERAVNSGDREAFRAACVNETNIAWYQNRDNTMSDANDEVGKAMAVIIGGNGTLTQAIQVCPGVYLATAHGALDNPIRARELNRPYRKPGKFGMRLIAYPMSRENMTEAADESDYISPRLRDPSKWESGNENTDYVFIKVDTPPRPNSFVTPLNMTPDEMVENSDSLEVSMYRGKSRYQTNSAGDLDFSEENAIARDDYDRITPLYQTPQRVNQNCSVVQSSGPITDGYIRHTCPSERGVSGSSLTTKIDGKSYLLGLHARGISANLRSVAEDGVGASAIASSEFCADYQTACGKPCPTLNKIRSKSLEENIQTVSL